MNATTTENDFKIIDAKDASVIVENITWNEAMGYLAKNKNYCVMDQDADIADRLERRAKMIAGWRS